VSSTGNGRGWWTLGLLPAVDLCLLSGEYRSYVENSIVDASIFLVETAAFCEVVVIRGKTMFVVRSRFVRGG
jgi:hypothetical protein